MKSKTKKILAGAGAGALAAPVASLAAGPAVVNLSEALPDSSLKDYFEGLATEMSRSDLEDFFSRPFGPLPDRLNRVLEGYAGDALQNKHLFGALKASQPVDALLGNTSIPASMLSAVADEMAPASLTRDAVAASVKDRLLKGTGALASGGAATGGLVGALLARGGKQKVPSSSVAKAITKSPVADSLLSKYLNKATNTDAYRALFSKFM